MLSTVKKSELSRIIHDMKRFLFSLNRKKNKFVNRKKNDFLVLEKKRELIGK
jgi:hypothetical protein